jgi:signal transduction histidine kinase
MNGKNHIEHRIKSSREESRKQKSIKRVLGTAALLLMFLIFQIAGYGIAFLLFGLTGRPADTLAYIISVLIGILLIWLFFGLLTSIFGRKQFERQHGLYTRLTDTLAKIAQGNFDVLIDPVENNVYSELAEAINDMARSLGTLESMRQDFISNVSHEIQSPLTSINGFAELLKNDGLPDEERRRYVEIIGTESKRLSSLSDNLLKLTALENGQKPLDKQEYSLDKQLGQAALSLEPQWAGKNIVLEADLPKLNIHADEDLLSQVWVNLLNNAVKFTPEGGHINIALSVDDGFAVVKISDTGAGIGKDDLPHIFERFYKADKARDRSLGGNGLGLSLVKKIVELHGGSITVESEPGRGTVFKISIPK